MTAHPHIRRDYLHARGQYASLGVDTDKALLALARIPVSLQCWQGDDVAGFESAGGLSSGGIMATGNYPGRARDGDELRADIDKALSLAPGKHRVNIHAIYAETRGKRVERTELRPEHFDRWVDWARQRKLGLDFNPTFFSHPKAAAGFTLSSADPNIRNYWIEHGRACRHIGAHFGKSLETPCVTNFWIPDGYKDTPADRATPRRILRESLDKIFAEKIDHRWNRDAVESKLFGIGSESYVVGSHEFYLGYAVSRKIMPCFDMGHFHPTESVADKISSALLFSKELLLHVSRGVRWDSDHVVTLTDELRAVAQEIVRGGFVDRVHLGLDYFDASINRIAAWVIGMRSLRKALLAALLEPREMLVRVESHGDLTGRLALQEQSHDLPFGAVWDYYCESNGVSPGDGWLAEVRDYERDVLSARVSAPVRASHDDLDDLVFVSHVLGRDRALVQAGGGNSSVKSADGRFMYVKASGCSMADMDRQRGWVKVDLATVRSLFDRRAALGRLSPARREKQVLESLMQSIVEPMSGRASVETPLHALLGRVVMHAHPVAVNAVTCSPRGETLVHKLDCDRRRPALWVPYTDPGSTLAFALYDRITAYAKKYRALPRVIFLENHGIFCSADTARDCIELLQQWTDAIDRHVRGAGGRQRRPNALTRTIARALARAGMRGAVVRMSDDPDLVDATNNGGDLAQSLTPDQIVYAGPGALVVDPGCTEQELVSGVRAFQRQRGAFPRTIVVKGVGVFVAGATHSQIIAAEALAAATNRTVRLARRQVKPLTPRARDFIVNWEAEHYRAKTQEKTRS